MKVRCPHCGGTVAVKGIGRPASNIGVTEVCDILRLTRSIPAAAEKLGCPRGLVYKIVKAAGLTVKGVLDG